MKNITHPRLDPARIKSARLAAGLTQTDAAARAGLARSNYAAIESGDRRNPTFAVMARIARAMGCPLDDFVGK